MDDVTIDVRATPGERRTGDPAVRQSDEGKCFLVLASFRFPCGGRVAVAL